MRQQNKYRRLRCSDALNELEREVLMAYARGLRRDEIGRQVGLAERTVGAYLTTVKEKLGARNLAHAVALGGAGAA